MKWFRGIVILQEWLFDRFSLTKSKFQINKGFVCLCLGSEKIGVKRARSRR